MKRTVVSAAVAAVLATVTLMARSTVETAIEGSERHRQSDHQWAGPQHEQHRHRRESVDSHQHRLVVESGAARASDCDLSSRRSSKRWSASSRSSPNDGRFNFPGYQGPDPNNVMRLGTDIRYAMNFPGEDGGRRIVIITPRVIGFREASNRPRSFDYPFTLFEMRFNKEGRGDGRMAYATQIVFDKSKNTIEIENYSSEPVRLNNLQLEVRK